MRKLLTVGILLCLLAASQIVTVAQQPTPLPVCQTYHLTVNETTVRTCPDGNCQSIRRLLQGAELCVLGVSDEDPTWLELNLAEDNNPPVIGFVESGLVSPGTATTNPNSSLFCLQYRVPVNTQVSAHACPDPDCPVLQTLSSGTDICALQYSYQFVLWTSIGDPSSGLQGWLPSSTIAYQYDESFGCPDFSFEAVVDTPVRECPREGCATVTNLAAGARVCALEDASQEFAWFSYAIDASTEGWVFEPLLDPIEADDNQQTEPETQPSPTATVQPQAIAVNDISRREGTGVGSARLVSILDAGQSVPILGQTLEGQYLVQMPDGERLLLSTDLFTVIGNPDGILFVTETGQPLFTPTPELPAQPDIQPTATIASVACQPYVVTVDNAATVRSFPGLQSNVITYLAGGDNVCVLRPAPDVINWLELELSPEDGVENLGYISQALVAPIDSNTTAAQVEPTPTQIVLPTQVTVPTATQPSVETVQIATTVPGLVPVATSALTINTLGQTGDAAAQSPFAPPPTQIASDTVFGQQVTLAEIFIESLELESPQGSVDIFFRIPDDWQPVAGSALQLDVDYFESVVAEQSGETLQGSLVSQLDVTLDGILVSSTSFTSDNTGRQILEIPLPEDILQDEQTRFHNLNLRLDAQDHCEVNARSRITSDGRRSSIRFAYQEFAPILDLAQYPRPIYNQPLPPEIEQVWMVLPDNPTLADYQAAASVATGLGYLTDNDVRIGTTTASLLSAQDRLNNHLILIGQPDRNILTRGFYDRNLLPTSRSSSGAITANGVEITTTDGIVQLVQHPDNTNRAVIVVTGQSDIALMKAAQALAGPPSSMGLGGTLAVIAETQPVVRLNRDERGSVAPVFTRTFAELGIDEDITLTGLGGQVANIQFDVPIGGVVTEDAYVDILFNNAMSVEVGNNSSLTVLINEVPVASSVLTGRENVIDTGGIVEPRRLRARIPGDAIRPGESNSMTIFVDTRGEWECDIPALQSIWVNISRSSVIHLPQAILPPELDVPLVSYFPAPFNNVPNLSNIMVSLPVEPTLDDVNSMVGMLARLASGVSAGEGFTPVVFTGSIPAGTNLEDHDFIVIGRPTTNPFLALLNDNLPQPFVPGTDDLQQVIDDVSYRLLPGFNIGLLQTLNSPWNTDKAVFVMTGTSEGGQRTAAIAMLSGNFFRFQLQGNIVYVTDTSISAVDTRDVVNVLELLQEVPSLLQATPLPTNTPRPLITVTPAETVTPSPVPTEGPTIPPTLIFTLTPEPTVPTAIPTLEPLPQIPPEQLEAVSVERPDWILGLLAVTGISVLASLIYGLMRTIAYMRRQRKSD